VHPDLPRSQYSTMAGDDSSLCIDQDRTNEAELFDTPGNLPNLSAGVKARIPRIELERQDREIFDCQNA
ncbi:MAG: hypothetical protein WA734_19015, partial [Candidatus Acidiferrales bacterium]